MSAQECSHVWSEVLITTKAFRRTVSARQSRFSLEIWPSASEIHPPSRPFRKTTLGSLCAGLAVTLDYPRIDGPKIWRVISVGSQACRC